MSNKHECDTCGAQFSKGGALRYHQKQIKATIRGNERLCAYRKRIAEEKNEPKYLFNVFGRWKLWRLEDD